MGRIVEILVIILLPSIIGFGIGYNRGVVTQKSNSQQEAIDKLSEFIIKHEYRKKDEFKLFSSGYYARGRFNKLGDVFIFVRNDGHVRYIKLR